MKVSLILSVLLYLWIGSSVGFLLDDISTTKGTTVSTTSKGKCSIDVFENCTSTFTSLINVTDNGDVFFDREGLQEFYCGPNAAESIQCLRDHVDPTCGPDTDAAIINKTLANIPPDFSYDTYCRNDTDYNELLSCQLLLPKVQGYIDCITGDTLNKTLDPTDTCNFFESTLGCSYKYSKFMCPDSIDAFKEYANNTGNCNPDYENSPEASSCDDDMKEACSVAYQPPSLVNSTTTEITGFICSKRSLAYQVCLQNVFDLCKFKNGFDISSISSDILLYESQTVKFCSGNKEIQELTKCQTKFPTLNAFQDCITGKTLNETTDPTDQCNFFQTTIGCTYKYTDLMCPDSLDAFNKTIALPPNCQQNIDLSRTVTSCDNNTDLACSAAYSPPVTNDPEEYFEFICSGRGNGYITCLQKVQALCPSSKIDVSEVLRNAQLSENQTEIICADKTRFKAFAKCLAGFTTSNEYTECVTTADSSDTCGVVLCNLKSMQKSCTSSIAFYKKLNRDALVDCNFITASGTLIIPSLVSSSSNLEVSVLASVFVVWHAYMRFF